MAITSAIVLYAVIWFMVLFISLPIGLRTQGDEGDIVPGTHAGSPANFNIKRTFIWVTIIGTTLWAISTAVILSGALSIHDLDPFSESRPTDGKDG